MTKEEVKSLWDSLEDIAMNPETEELEEEWNGFPIGTSKDDLWHWFDTHYEDGVYALVMGR